MNEFRKYFLDVYRYKFADFRGRATRSEYWFFTLFQTLLYFGIVGLILLVSGPQGIIISIPIILLMFVVTLIPNLALSARRLHDTGNSAWMYLISLIPGGGIVIFIFACLDSQPHANKWGPNPKAINSRDEDHLIDNHLLDDQIV